MTHKRTPTLSFLLLMKLENLHQKLCIIWMEGNVPKLKVPLLLNCHPHPGADLGFQRAGELLGVRALFSEVEGT